MAEPQLQKPGAGLPTLERLFLKHIFMPTMIKSTTWDDARTKFLEQTDLIIGLYQTIKPQDRTRKVLISRLVGLEDSSRYWSANMVLEHVIIVTNGIVQTIEMLSQEKSSHRRISTADVKPAGATDDDMVPVFWETMHQCADRLSAVTNQFSTTTHDHPWFGPLNTHGWYTLLPIHHGIHRRQLERIIRCL